MMKVRQNGGGADRILVSEIPKLRIKYLTQ